jgi:ATP synthase protein I
MQVNDVRVLKSAALPTAVVGVVAAIVSLFAVGGSGALGAAVGVLLVAVFFTIGLVAVSWAGRISPTAMFAAAMVSYLLKVIVIGILLQVFEGIGAWHFPTFAWTVVAGTIAWIGGEVWGFTRLKMLYVDDSVTKAPGRAEP